MTEQQMAPHGETGDERVDAIIGPLAGVDELPLAERLTAFAALHTALAEVLDAEAP